MQKSIDSNDTSNSGLSATATATPTNENSDESHENGSGSIKNEESSNGTANENGNGNGNGNGNVGDQTGLNLKMSAKELRAKLAMRKKYDPKKESLGFKDKFDIVQKL